MRLTPSTTVLEAVGATEVESVCKTVDSIDGPTHTRMLRGQMPPLFSTLIKVGRVPVPSGIRHFRGHRQKASAGTFRNRFAICISTPFNADAMLHLIVGMKGGAAASETQVSKEGLGSLMAVITAGHGPGRRLGQSDLKDVYDHGGSRPCLTNHHSLDETAPVRGLKGQAGERSGIDRIDLAATSRQCIQQTGPRIFR